MRILITGSAGFIGFHLCKSLLKKENIVLGIDNLNDYYDVKLKQDRNKELEKLKKEKNYSWEFLLGSLEDYDFLEKTFKNFKPEIVINLAAQAGVRYSLKNPRAYISSNIVGFFNVIECCRKNPPEHFFYASSSSVYGGNTKIPFSEKDPVDHPESLYAATKRSNELIAQTYSNLYNLQITGLRFFTVYGPWGRPDMAPMIFTKSILQNNPIKVFNYGDMERDFTYIDDVIKSIEKLIENRTCKVKWKNYENAFKNEKNVASHRIINIGNSSPIKLLDFINLIENKLKKTAKKDFLPMQSGDVKKTYADTNLIENITKFKPSTALKDGIEVFVDWYMDYYK